MSHLTVTDFTAPPSPGLDPGRHKRRLAAHRRERCLSLGPCMRLQFEDASTLHHLIQETLRGRRAASALSIQHEIDTLAHLLPDGTDWKATLTIAPADAPQPRLGAAALREAAHRLYIDLPRQQRVYALVEESPSTRHTGRKQAAAATVHALRFEFCESRRAALLAGATATLGCAHEQYEFRRVIPAAAIARLRRDLLPAARACASA